MYLHSYHQLQFTNKTGEEHSVRWLIHTCVLRNYVHVFNTVQETTAMLTIF